MTLQEQNQAFAFQKQMSESKHADFANVYAKALPRPDGTFDRTAVEVFAAWASIHEDLAPAMAFLKEATKDSRGTLAIALGISSCCI